MSAIPDKPVAPEFVSVLYEHAGEALINYLTANHAPDAVITLVQHMDTLAFYHELSKSGREDEVLFRSMGIGEAVIDTINAIAEIGGEFRCPSGASIPRQPVAWVQSGNRRQR